MTADYVSGKGVFDQSWLVEVLDEEEIETRLNEVISNNENGFNIPYTDDIEATDKGLVITGQPDFDTWHSLWQWLKER